MKFSIKKAILFFFCATVLVSISAFKINPPARKIKLGFIPLTDCAPLVAAKELGLFAKYSLDSDE